MSDALGGQVETQRVDSQRAECFAAEIRKYLIGRVGARPITDELDRWRSTGLDGSLYGSPVLSWWVLEGQRFGRRNESLCESWSYLVRQARMLLTAYSPRMRVTESPDGPVDWVGTIQQRASEGSSSFVCLTSHVGLGDDERRALCGWAGWVSGLWRDYCASIRKDRKPSEVEPLERIASITSARGGAPNMSQIHRWAHIARRSRWPLLRNVVAESLRSAIDMRQIDRIPLPAEPAELFELLCLVRVLRTLEPKPTAIRWMMHDHDNTIAVPGMTAHFQYTFPRAEVVRSGAFNPQLAHALTAFGISEVPVRTDVIIRFAEPRRGFDGILIEAKSGGASHGDALLQLQAYGATIRARWGGRWIHWAVVEREDGAIRPERWERLAARASAPEHGDLVVFSTADEIERVLSMTIGLI